MEGNKIHKLTYNEKNNGKGGDLKKKTIFREQIRQNYRRPKSRRKEFLFCDLFLAIIFF